jgi:hypothetical protein
VRDPIRSPPVESNRLCCVGLPAEPAGWKSNPQRAGAASAAELDAVGVAIGAGQRSPRTVDLRACRQHGPAQAGRQADSGTVARTRSAALTAATDYRRERSLGPSLDSLARDQRRAGGRSRRARRQRAAVGLARARSRPGVRGVGPGEARGRRTPTPEARLTSVPCALHQEHQATSTVTQLPHPATTRGAAGAASTPRATDGAALVGCAGRAGRGCRRPRRAARAPGRRRRRAPSGVLRPGRECQRLHRRDRR